ncbi:MAG: hypothetical protein SFX73_18735 [Kofleriaceae bacterium]|nr:hypothetical protein [Kofleriaceae bacterium]
MATLLTTSTRNGDSIVLTCTGSAESDSLAALEAVLQSTHDSATQATVRAVVADLRGLEFAASSCLKVFVSWLQRIQQLERSERYKVVFRSATQHSWQRRSLGALAAFAADIVEIQMEAA